MDMDATGNMGRAFARKYDIHGCDREDRRAPERESLDINRMLFAYVIFRYQIHFIFRSRWSRLYFIIYK